MFNPLSKNPLAIANNPFAYLTNPSTVTEAKQAAFFAKDTLNRNKAIVVTEGGTRQDTARVNAFARNFQADRNHQVEVMELADFNQATMETFVELLQTMGDSTVVIRSLRSGTGDYQYGERSGDGGRAVYADG